MTVGADVGKESLFVSDPDGAGRIFSNSEPGIDKLLKALPPGSTVAMEATGNYHKLLADTAYGRGFRVIVFNPKDVRHYATSISPRAKTDRVDAMVIAKYALVRADHHAYHPAPGIMATLRSMLRTRGSLVANRTACKNREKQRHESASYLHSAIEGLTASIGAIDQELRPIVATLPQYTRLKEIPGFGPVVTAYILAMLASVKFACSDSFVAFVGLDIKVKQSGKKKGRWCLTKRGDPESRRLLYLAAQAACRGDGPFRDMYLRYQLRGLSKIAATNAVARKLARVAWAMYTKNENYCLERVSRQPRGKSKKTGTSSAVIGDPKQTLKDAARSKLVEIGAGGAQDAVSTPPSPAAHSTGKRKPKYICHAH